MQATELFLLKWARRFCVAVLCSVLLSACAMAQPAESTAEDADLLQPFNVLPGAASTASPTSLWARLHAGFRLAPPQSPWVERFAQQYAVNNVLESAGRRAAPLLYLVVEEVEKRGLPLELALIPFVESAFQPTATSHVGAHGPWQFMPFTGKRFGLAQDRMRDERRAWLASTRAALSYLQTLFDEFGDWHLAIAAYNAGEGRIAAARRAAQAAGIAPRFENLRLPNETRDYVPRVFALAQLIATQLETLTAIPNSPSLTVVPVTQDMDVKLAIRFSGLQEAQFRQLNPAFSGPLIAAATAPELLLPMDTAQAFEAALSRHTGPLATWRLHRVTYAASPATLARDLGISVPVLLEHNPLPASHRYRAGAAIFVPRNPTHDDGATQLTLDQISNAALATEPMFQRLVLHAKPQGARRGLITHRKGQRVHVKPAAPGVTVHAVSRPAGHAKGARPVLRRTRI